MVPLGFVGWICMQSGFVTQLLTFIFAENSALQSGSSLYVANSFTVSDGQSNPSSKL